MRRFALAYLPDTCIRPFLLLGGLLLLLGLGVTLTAPNVTWLLTGILIMLAIAQFLRVRREIPIEGAPPGALRLARVWQREAKPLIMVALFTSFFGDVDILLVTPLLTSAETAVFGLCLKLSLLVGFAVQVAHQVVVPDLADARVSKDEGATREALRNALGFPLLVTLGALATVVLFGHELLAVFGPEFTSAKLPLAILMACQVVRALFGPSVSLLTVIGAQKENAALALGSLALLVAANIVLAPLYGVLGASVAVAIVTLAWLVASAIVLAQFRGLRTDALYLMSRH
jgi:O-antigen/teichoic acid export membrane protein